MGTRLVPAHAPDPDHNPSTTRGAVPMIRSTITSMSKMVRPERTNGMLDAKFFAARFTLLP